MCPALFSSAHQRRQRQWVEDGNVSRYAAKKYLSVGNGPAECALHDLLSSFTQTGSRMANQSPSTTPTGNSPATLLSIASPLTAQWTGRQQASSGPCARRRTSSLWKAGRRFQRLGLRQARFKYRNRGHRTADLPQVFHISEHAGGDRQQLAPRLGDIDQAFAVATEDLDAEPGLELPDLFGFARLRRKAISVNVHTA